MNRLMRNIRRWSKRSTLLAINDNSLESWFDSLGILDRVKCGEMECCVCTEKTSIDHIQMVSRIKGEIVIICDKPECVNNFKQAYAKA